VRVSLDVFNIIGVDFNVEKKVCRVVGGRVRLILYHNFRFTNVIKLDIVGSVLIREHRDLNRNRVPHHTLAVGLVGNT